MDQATFGITGQVPAPRIAIAPTCWYSSMVVRRPDLFLLNRSSMRNGGPPTCMLRAHRLVSSEDGRLLSEQWHSIGWPCADAVMSDITRLSLRERQRHFVYWWCAFELIPLSWIVMFLSQTGPTTRAVQAMLNQATFFVYHLVVLPAAMAYFA